MIKALKLDDDITIVGDVVAEVYPTISILEPIIMDFSFNDEGNANVYADKYTKLNDAQTPIDIDISHVLISYVPSVKIQHCYLKFKDELNDRYNYVVDNTYLKAYELDPNRIIH